jgi:hypothetical protein
VEEAWQFGVHEEQIELLFPLHKQLLLAMKLEGYWKSDFANVLKLL